jgi:hypothetical protein
MVPEGQVAIALEQVSKVGTHAAQCYMSQWTDPVVPGGTHDLFRDCLFLRRMGYSAPAHVNQQGIHSPFRGASLCSDVESSPSGQPRRGMVYRRPGHTLARLPLSCFSALNCRD